MNDKAIEISNLNFSYKDKKVLKNLNVAFNKNKLSVLLGINGGGKSTLFKLIAGILKEYEGSISILETELSKLTFKERAEKIGFLPQFNSSIFSFTVEEILLTGRMAFSGFNPTKQDKLRVSEIVKELDIEPLKNKYFNTLSGGEQQIVMIGRLLIQNPQILLLDEPTNHLDVYYQHFLMEKLKTYSQNNGMTVISIMHNPTLAFQYADYFHYLHDGHVHTPVQAHLPDLKLLEDVYNVKFAKLEDDEREYILPIKNISLNNNGIQ